MSSVYVYMYVCVCVCLCMTGCGANSAGSVTSDRRHSYEGAKETRHFRPGNQDH